MPHSGDVSLHQPPQDRPSSTLALLHSGRGFSLRVGSRSQSLRELRVASMVRMFGSFGAEAAQCHCIARRASAAAQVVS